MRYNPFWPWKADPVRKPLKLLPLYLKKTVFVHKTVEYYHFYVKNKFSKFSFIVKVLSF